jgi:hypothetical protein
MTFGNFYPSGDRGCDLKPLKRLRWRLAVAIAVLLIAVLFGHGAGGD